MSVYDIVKRKPGYCLWYNLSLRELFCCFQCVGNHNRSYHLQQAIRADEHEESITATRKQHKDKHA